MKTILAEYEIKEAISEWLRKRGLKVICSPYFVLTPHIYGDINISVGKFRKKKKFSITTEIITENVEK